MVANDTPNATSPERNQTMRNNDVTKTGNSKTFTDIMLEAVQFAISLRGITHQHPDATWTQHPGDIGGERTWGIDELADHLSAIHAVLGIIAETPNGYINQEALEGLREQFTPAIDFLATDWAKQVEQEGCRRFLQGGPSPKQQRHQMHKAAPRMHAALEASVAMLGHYRETATGNRTRDRIDKVLEQACNALAAAKAT
jgi:hypothetical protein